MSKQPISNNPIGSVKVHLSKILGLLGVKKDEISVASVSIPKISIHQMKLILHSDWSRKKGWTISQTEKLVLEYLRILCEDKEGYRLGAESGLEDVLDEMDAIAHLRFMRNIPHGESMTFFCEDYDIEVLFGVIKALLARGLAVSKMYIASNEKWNVRFTVVGLRPEVITVKKCFIYEAYECDKGEDHVLQGMNDLKKLVPKWEQKRLIPKGDRKIAFIIGGELHYPTKGIKRVITVEKIPNNKFPRIFHFIWNVFTCGQRLGLHFAVRFNFNQGKMQLEIFDAMSKSQEMTILYSILEWVQFLLEIKLNTLPDIDNKLIA